MENDQQVVFTDLLPKGMTLEYDGKLLIGIDKEEMKEPA
jgi:hypothetical protein